MDALMEAFRDFRTCARPLGEYENIPLNELADKYCEATDNKDESKRNIYFSALVLRFWYKVNKMYTENLSLGIDRIDCLTWLTEAILMVCEKDKRAWQTNPKLNVQQVINQTLATRFVAAAYYDSNLKKNQGKHNIISLDQTVDDEGLVSMSDTIADDNSNITKDVSDSSYIVQGYLDDNKIVEAIILDNVATKDVFKQDKKVIKEKDENGKITKHTETSTTFWPFKLVKELNTLDESYIDYFLNTYTVSKKAFEAAFNAIRKANNQKKYKMVNATLNDFKTSLMCE